jgi:hypothetical protein
VPASTALAAHSASIGSVDLDHVDALRVQMATQARSVGAGALYPHRPDRAVISQPREQVAIPVGAGFELGAAEDPARRIDRRSLVGVPVGVHAADDNNRIPCHA